MAKTYEDDQLPLEAIDPGMFGGPKLTHAQAALLAAYKKLPDTARAMLKRQALGNRMDYIPGRDIREAVGMFKSEKEEPQNVLMNSMADSMAAEPDAFDGEDVFADTTDDDPFADSFGAHKVKRA